MANSFNKLEVRIQGDIEQTLNTRNISHVASSVQRLTYTGNKQFPDTSWANLTSKSNDCKESVNLPPVVVSVTDGNNPSQRRPILSPRGQARGYLSDSFKDWEFNKLDSAGNSCNSTFGQRKSGSLDPRFRRVVPNRRPQKLDIGTDTEDLHCREKPSSTQQNDADASKIADDADCKTTRSLVVTRETPEKPGDLVFPLKKALSVDCGVQTLDIERRNPKLRAREAKRFNNARRSTSDISLGQSSCDTKKTYSDTSLNSNAADDQCWAEKLKARKKSTREYDISEHVSSRKLNSKSDSANRYPPEKDNSEWHILKSQKFPLTNESSFSLQVPRTCSEDKQMKYKTPEPSSSKNSCNKKSSVKCGYSQRRRSRGSNTNVCQKNIKHTNSLCKHCISENPTGGILKDETVKGILTILGGVFVATATFWVVSILFGFFPAIYEWFYPPQDDDYIKILSIFSKFLGY